MAIRSARLGSSQDNQGNEVYVEYDIDDVTQALVAVRVFNATNQPARLTLWSAANPNRRFERVIDPNTPLTTLNAPTGIANRLDIQIVAGRVSGLEGGWEWPYLG